MRNVVVTAAFLLTISACPPSTPSPIDAGVVTEGEGEGVDGEGEGEGIGEGEGEGDAGPDGPGVCNAGCNVDDDCKSGGQDIGLACIEHVCSPRRCSDDVLCTALFSGWSQPCTRDVDCFQGHCVDIGEPEGVCSSDQLCQFGNGFTQLIEHDFEDFDVPVCARPAFCDASTGQCSTGCVFDFDCGPGLFCSSSGQCVQCRADTDCPPFPGVDACLPGGFCGCRSDADCSSSPTQATCHAGHCGCTTDDDCTAAPMMMMGGTTPPGFSHCVEGTCGCNSSDECAGLAPTFDHSHAVCAPISTGEGEGEGEGGQ